MTRFAVLLPVAVTACVAPSGGWGEDSGLEFRGIDVANTFDPDPGPTAVGGTQHVSLFIPESNDEPFTAWYVADSSHPGDERYPLGTEVVAQDHNVVTVRGIGAGYSDLRIVSAVGELYDHMILSAEPVALVQARPSELYGSDVTEPIVWARGDQDITIRLWSAPDAELEDHRDALVDESLTLSMPGASQTTWQTIHVPDAPAGHRALAVSGSVEQILDIETIGEPDALEIDEGSYQFGGATGYCVTARHQGRYVAGAAWSFTVDGGDIVPDPAFHTATSGCVDVFPRVPGTMHIHATASGLTRVFDVTAQY
ncbi:MAG TPA: hypothetical protein VGM39_17860 [Kofleriaceae bacterium]|jgi:hypothetical protein